MRRLIALILGTLGLVLQAESASASAFRVTPIQVVLSGKSSTLLTLMNESDQSLRFQISAFAWTQSPAGEIKLAPTEDILFFPSLLTLKPGEERKVRVGANVAAGETEKTYRIFFEELPPAEKPASDKRTSEVRILTKMGVPIFIQPPKTTAEARVADLKSENGRVSFQVSNRGNTHYSVRTIHLTATGAGGEKVFSRDLDGWYILSAGVRDYGVDLPSESCPSIRSIKVEVVTDISTDVKASTVSTEQTFPTGPSCRKK
jgi:fimbrial chaperone protein